MCRESVLNDAVAIVLYRTLATFTTATVTMGSMVGALGMFFIIFTGSVAIGGILALCLALLFKHTHFRTDPDLHYMETCLVVLVPYMSYTLAEAFSLSGIVSILFCGITMAHYMRPNLSPWSQAATKNIFKTLALLAETFVFVYMVGCPPLLPFVLYVPLHAFTGVWCDQGMAAFLSNQKWTAIPFTLVAILGMVLGRAANVYPNVYLINRWRHPSNHIPEKHSMMLNISGLRGAIAFALACTSPRRLAHVWCFPALVPSLAAMLTAANGACSELACYSGRGDRRSNADVHSDHRPPHCFGHRRRHPYTGARAAQTTLRLARAARTVSRRGPKCLRKPRNAFLRDPRV
jgi:NhaP-type Na+/H+ or K+/H+ antiporter